MRQVGVDPALEMRTSARELNEPQERHRRPARRDGEKNRPGAAHAVDQVDRDRQQENEGEAGQRAHARRRIGREDDRQDHQERERRRQGGQGMRERAANAREPPAGGDPARGEEDEEAVGDRDLRGKESEGNEEREESSSDEKPLRLTSHVSRPPRAALRRSA